MTISIISCFSSSSPATSSNVVFTSSSSASYIFPLSPSPCICINNTNNTNINIVGNIENALSAIDKNTLGFSCINVISFPSCTFSWTNSINACVLGTIAVLGSSCSFKFTLIVVLPTVIFIFSTFPSFICLIKSVYEIWSSGITSSSFFSFITVYTTAPNITNASITINIHNNIFLFLSLSFLLLFLFFLFSLSLFLLSFNFLTSKQIYVYVILHIASFWFISNFRSFLFLFSLFSFLFLLFFSFFLFLLFFLLFFFFSFLFL